LPTLAVAAGLVSGIDAMQSTVMQKGQSSFSGLGVRVRLQPASLIKAIELMPEVEYWRNGSTISPYNITTSRTDATLGMETRYKFSAAGLRPYLGVGFGIHFLSSEVNA